jgi:hypothetical protein
MTNRASALLSRILGLRHRINEEKISFLAFDALYYEPGREEALYELLEGVLQQKGHYIGMMMMDVESGLYDMFMKRKKLGFLYKFMGAKFADVRVRFIQIPETIKQVFRKRPTYIPTYDNS